MAFTVIAATVCDQVLVDKDTMKPAVIGLFSRIATTEVPAVHFRAAAFFRLGGVSPTLAKAKVEYVTPDGTVLIARDYDVKGPQIDVAITLSALPLPAFGPYMFRLTIDGTIAAEACFDVVRQEKKPPQPSKLEKTP